MKRFLALFLMFVMCLSFSACQKNADNQSGDNTSAQCTEQELRMLIERNIDCYYLFYVAPLSTDGDADKDGYKKADTNFFENYDAMYEFLSSTYTSSRTKWLLKYPTTGKPLYKNVDGDIYVNADVIKKQTYEVAWDEYDIEFTKNKKNNCEFTLTTGTFTGDAYVTTGSAVLEDGEWKLTDIVY